MIRIDQFLPHLHRGDAIGDSAMMMAACFRKWGHEAAIYCYGADPGLMGENVRRIEDWRREKGLAIQVLHYALPSALSAWWSRLQGKRILIHHNLTPAKFFASTDSEMAEIVQRGENELRALARYTDLGLGDSEWNRRELEGFGYRKTGVLPILIDFSRYDVAPRPGLRKALADGIQNLLFVGRIAPNKGHRDLLKVFKLYQKRIEPRSRLILVGKPDRHLRYASSLLELARDERIDNSHLAGAVDHRDLCTYYQASRLFLCASEHEGFCVPLLESFHFDLPVLALRRTAVPFTLGGAGLSFDEIEPAAVAELIALVLSDDRLRRTVLDTQRKRLEAFSMERVEQTLRSAIDSLLG